MLRTVALLIAGIFSVSGVFLYGCQTAKKVETGIERNFKLDSSSAYPQGQEAEIEQRGEP